MIHPSEPTKKSESPIADSIKNRLESRFAPLRLELIDESHRHAGHAGAHESGESHFRCVLVSAAFTGLSRVARQRAVNECLSDLLAERVHAFSMSLRSPEEDHS